MRDGKYQDIPAGIALAEGHVEHFFKSGEFDLAVDRIKSNSGNPYACITSLASIYLAQAMLAWFKECDLTRFKQHLYTSAQLERMALQYKPGRAGEYLYFSPLLSDHRELCRWFSSSDVQLPGVARDDPKSNEFRWMQLVHAMRGDWDALGRRAEAVLELSPNSQKKYLVDHRFYLSLARRDVDGMQSALQELTSERVARHRNNEIAFHYSHRFVSPYAVMYAKLAWVHGFQIEIDSPYVPMAWLPLSPLAEYQDIFPFTD